MVNWNLGTTPAIAHRNLSLVGVVFEVGAGMVVWVVFRRLLRRQSDDCV